MLEVITGAMEAGKTWLIYKRISDANLMGKKVQVFAYPVHQGEVVSRIGFKHDAITVPTVTLTKSSPLFAEKPMARLASSDRS